MDRPKVRRAASVLDSAGTSRLPGVTRIGNTPMQEIVITIDRKEFHLHFKMEGDNAFGSIKARAANAIINGFERAGMAPNSMIIESSSGNFAIAMAGICSARGYEFIAVVDPKVSEEAIRRIHEAGGQIVTVSERDKTGGYLITRLEKVSELLKAEPLALWPDQYHNFKNPMVHFETTSPEILEQMGGKVDVILVAVSTGGTAAGVANFFRANSPSTRIVFVDARGSVALGGDPAPRLLNGIGASQLSQFVSKSMYDDIIRVTDERAFSFSRNLQSWTGIRVGGSTGALLAAAADYLPSHPELRRIVCISPDSGLNDISTIYRDEWLITNGLDPNAGIDPVDEIRLGEILQYPYGHPSRVSRI